MQRNSYKVNIRTGFIYSYETVFHRFNATLESFENLFTILIDRVKKN